MAKRSASKADPEGSTPSAPAMKYARKRLTSWRATMYYVYVLRSLKDGKLYIGSTSDLKQRCKQHYNGEVVSTKGRRPLKLIFYEAFSEKEDAIRREHYFKTNSGKRTLKLMLRKYFNKDKE